MAEASQLNQMKSAMLEYYFGSGAPEAQGTKIPKPKPQDIAEFEAFARKAANSPELAYLTILALAYRHTKDPTLIARFSESRMKVQGHLDAIDQILGSPGA